MRILVENGCYGLRNMGDVAMLQVAVARLSTFWPDATIEVITDEPALLAKYCPKACPIPAQGRHIWFKDRNLLGALYRLVPRAGSKHLPQLAHQIRHHWPGLARQLIQLHGKYRGTDTHEMDRFLEALLEADLVTVSGGGDINDAFIEYAITLLSILAMSTQRGIPIAMFGQGIGPIDNPKLRAKVQAVLPSVDLIAIRESRAGPALLNELGIPPNHVTVTGDDAIELSFESRTAKLGNGIGVNLRATEYSKIGNNHIQMVRSALENAVGKHNTQLIPLPISFYDKESDARTIRQLLAGHDNTSDGEQRLDEPAKIIEKVAECRVVVTGAYHGAVFALAKGIPVVGLANSAYYKDKFLGLAEQFRCGCQVLCLDDKCVSEKLLSSIDTAWNSAEQVKPRLLEAAEQQIASSKMAYQKIYNLIESKKNKVEYEIIPEPQYAGKV